MDGNTQIDSHVQMDAISKATSLMMMQAGDNQTFAAFLVGLARHKSPEVGQAHQQVMEKSMETVNAIAKAFREDPRAAAFATPSELIQKGKLSKGAIAKAALDVGYVTNFANITGGQTLGYVSLDTRLARGTVRPSSFTMYQCLRKTAAYQVVDYFGSVTDTGGGLPGTAFMSTTTAGQGTLAATAGQYQMNNINLKLLVDTRAITIALAAQNSYVDVGGQETINASLNILSTVNWACYWGSATLYPIQFNGIATQIPAVNVFNAYSFYTSVGAAEGWSKSQSMFNLIYEASGQITQYRTFGRITHAFMSPAAAASLQSLVTTLLNNLVTLNGPAGIIVNGDLQGMRTRFGEIKFPVDLFINSRDKPAQAILNPVSNANSTVSTVSRPAAVSGALVTGVASSGFDTAFTATSGIYSYVVASTDSQMNESPLTWMLSPAITISGVAVSGGITLTIVPPADVTAAAFRIYRSGLGYAPATSAVANPASYRFIGAVAANTSSNVTFTDNNSLIPGGETVFLLDMDDDDDALDFRYLLPLSRIDLFAQALYQPWAVAMIGAVRMKLPQFHGIIRNFIPDSPDWNPLSNNPNAT